MLLVPTVPQAGDRRGLNARAGGDPREFNACRRTFSNTPSDVVVARWRAAVAGRRFVGMGLSVFERALRASLTGLRRRRGRRAKQVANPRTLRELNTSTESEQRCARILEKARKLWCSIALASC